MSAVTVTETTSAAGSVSPRSATRPLRVCHVSVSLATGGLERLLVDFARFHSRDRFQMSFVALQGLGRPADDIRETGCEVRTLGSEKRGVVGRLRQLARLFEELDADIVHTHNHTPHLHGTLAARWARRPIVIQTRHGQRFGETWISRCEYRWMSRLVDRIVPVSDDAARLTIHHDGVGVRRVTRIWNGIDLDRFVWRGPASRPTAISVARLQAIKDFPTLIRAVPKVLAVVPDFRLRIVGDGPERPVLDQLVREMGLGASVELLGERHDVPELLADAGFFVSTSLSEGISLTLLEAMAVGLPILATHVGGNPEIVVDGVTGALIPPGDPEAIARGLIEMCQRSSQWRLMGELGRDRVERHFEIRGMLRKYERLYEDLARTKQLGGG